MPLCRPLCVCILCAQAATAQPAPESPPAANADAPPSAEAEPESEQISTPPPTVKLPRALRIVDAEYPPGAQERGREATVELFVVVLADGTVGDVQVAESGGQDFDDAAIAAVRNWNFEPALRGDTPVDSRIRIPFSFRLPPEDPPLLRDEENDDEAANPTALETKQDPPLEVIVQGKRELRTEDRSSSDFRVERDVLAAAPRQEGADVLRTAPGLYIGRGEGPAMAHNYMLRGFDSEHGQDIEFRVGGLPINLPSHIHGQGYSDLSFLIGDTVQELRITEGVYDPRQGDFAVAGSIDLALGVDEQDRGVHLRSGYGGFNTFRQLVMWAPRDAAQESFGAVQYMSTDGFGENRRGKSASSMLQHRFGTGAITYRAIGIIHAARSEMAGVVRQDDVDDGSLCFYCVYPYPTAQAQNALASRVLAGFFADYATDEGANGQIGVWAGYDNFRLQENFTGFLQESRVLARVGGRGDLIEQRNETTSLGLTGRYRTSLFRPAAWAVGSLELGSDGRFDVINQSQNLLDASSRNQTWDNRVDASVKSVDLGVWGDFDWTFTRYLSVRAGVRADVLSYDIEDRLGNFAPLTRPQDTFITGFRRSALGTAWGPRTSATVRPLQWMSVLAAYGEGYRSPQARLLEDGEEAPFSKVRSADVGVTFDWGDPLQLTIGGYYTHLSDDIAFDAAEGRLERIGASQRLGSVANAVTRPFSWLVGSASFTYVDATLLEPPPPTAEEPQPLFVEGQNLPFVPPVVVRADIGANRTFTENFQGLPLGGRTGLGLSFLSPRPLPYGEFADSAALLDASVGVRWGALDLSFEVFNVLNARYAAVEYSFASDWDPNDGVRPRTPARHLAAGAPRSWSLSLGVTL